MSEEPVGGRHPSALRLRHPALGGRPLLHGRCVILTGAGGGIGRSMAEAFVCAGATLAATDLAGGPLDELLAELRPVCSELGVDPPLARAFDASDLDAFQSFVEEVGAQTPQIDGLVNCAGAWRAAPYGELEPASFQAAVEQNLTTAFNGCRAVLPVLTRQRSGSVVNVASTAGEFGSITPAAHYAAAKGGVIALTKSLAREVGEFGVRVNAISPGPTDTIALGANTAAKKRAAGSRTLFGRLGRPEEIAYSALFLLSDLATFVTGQVLGVNGGSRL